MREAIFLHYRAGSTVWHRHNPSLKIGEMAFWSVSALLGDPWVLAVTGCVLLTAHGIAGSRPGHFRKPLLFWLVMAAAITLFAGLSDTAAAPLIVIGRELPVAIGRNGLIAGGIRALRLLVVLIAGQLLAATTDPGDLAEAMRRLTRFLPKTWSGTLATAIALTVSFIPRLMDEALTVRDAAFSRGLGLRRSIFRRALFLGLPLAEATLRRADLTAEALLSRCHTTDPTVTLPSIGAIDIGIACACVLPSLVTMVILWATGV